MAAQTGYKFQGWLALDQESVNGKMGWQTFEPKTWEETDVDIKVTHCGICGSDIHTLRSGWVRGLISPFQFLAVVLTLSKGPTLYPCCVGHEIVGTAVKVGSKVENGIE